MSVKNWTPYEIMKWFETTLAPLGGTKASQEVKWETEYREFTKAKTIKKKREEMADIFISAIALGYFSFDSSLIKIAQSLSLIRRDEKGMENFDLQKAVNEKMEINSKREWHVVEGEIRHKKGKEK